MANAGPIRTETIAKVNQLVADGDFSKQDLVDTVKFITGEVGKAAKKDRRELAKEAVRTLLDELAKRPAIAIRFKPMEAWVSQIRSTIVWKRQGNQAPAQPAQLSEEFDSDEPSAYMTTLLGRQNLQANYTAAITDAATQGAAPVAIEGIAEVEIGADRFATQITLRLKTPVDPAIWGGFINVILHKLGSLKYHPQDAADGGVGIPLTFTPPK